MKLLFCTQCNDVVALKMEQRSCLCGQSSGRYTDNLNAVIEGPSLALGFHNGNFSSVLRAQYTEGDQKDKFPNGLTKGRDFIAFIIPESAPTVTRKA